MAEIKNNQTAILTLLIEINEVLNCPSIELLAFHKGKAMGILTALMLQDFINYEQYFYVSECIQAERPKQIDIVKFNALRDEVIDALRAIK